MALARQVGEWRLGRRIGRGGMGAVYLAVSAKTGQQAALKEMLSAERNGARSAEQFEREARLLTTLVHPNIVGLLEVINTAAGGYLVLEFVPGESLRERLGRKPLSTAEAFIVMGGLLRALDHAHRRSVVHLDVKPENVLLSTSGEIKVTDFGIARWPRQGGVAGTHTTLGTPQYMSPEQAKGGEVDARSDLYSAGVVCYEMFCGRPPFPADPGGDATAVAARHVQADPDPPSAHRPDIDPELAQLIMRALAKSPADRHQSAAEFLTGLEPVAQRLAGDEVGRLPIRTGLAPEGAPAGWLARLLRTALRGQRA